MHPRRAFGCTAPYCHGGHAPAREWNAAVLRLQRTQPKNRRSTTGLRGNMGQYSLEIGVGEKKKQKRREESDEKNRRSKLC